MNEMNINIDIKSQIGTTISRQLSEIFSVHILKIFSSPLKFRNLDSSLLLETTLS